MKWEFVSQLSENQRLKKVLVDGSYQGISSDHGDFTAEVSCKKPDQKGFVPIHKRWVVERTFAWLKRQRRLARDDEFDSSHQQSMIYIAMSKIMLNRLA